MPLPRLPLLSFRRHLLHGYMFRNAMIRVDLKSSLALPSAAGAACSEPGPPVLACTNKGACTGMLPLILAGMCCSRCAPGLLLCGN